MRNGKTEPALERTTFGLAASTSPRRPRHRLHRMRRSNGMIADVARVAPLSEHDNRLNRRSARAVLTRQRIKRCDCADGPCESPERRRDLGGHRVHSSAWRGGPRPRRPRVSHTSSRTYTSRTASDRQGRSMHRLRPSTHQTREVERAERPTRPDTPAHAIGAGIIENGQALGGKSSPIRPWGVDVAGSASLATFTRALNALMLTASSASMRRSTRHRPGSGPDEAVVGSGPGRGKQR